jgi:hypothetical protein
MFNLILIILICIILFVICNKKFIKKSTLVLYTFHKYDKNVQFFIDHGLFKDANVDFIFIINDPKLKIECPDYVTVINRENTGYDFGAWSEGLLKNNLYKNYDNFIFVNSSVIGPIIPPYYKNKWTDIFLNGLNDKVKLYGCTINTCGINNCSNTNEFTHIQSYAFTTDSKGLKILIDNEIFSLTNQFNDYQDVVNQKEIKMSQIMLNNNYNIGCIFNYYKGIDFRNKTLEKSTGNLTVNNRFFDENLHPYDVIFTKEKNTKNKDWLNNYIA